MTLCLFIFTHIRAQRVLPFHKWVWMVLHLRVSVNGLILHLLAALRGGIRGSWGMQDEPELVADRRLR
jgi:hypothetical protein